MATLGTVGIADKGTYNASATYVQGNFVLYEGSTWLALKDNLTGIPPEEGENWKYLARGFGSDSLSQIEGIDTSGVLGTPGSTVVSQALIDALADKVMTKLLLKTDVINQFLNDTSKAASAALAYSLNQSVNTLNSNLTTVSNNTNAITPIALTALGTFLGTITRNASGISGKQINVSLTITAPVGGIANETTFFYINKKIKPVVAPILLSTYKAGYIYSSVNSSGDTIFAARVDGGIPGSAEIYINFSCLLDD